YYKKGASHLHIDGLLTSLGAVLRMTFPLLGIYLLALSSRAGRREAAFSIVPVALFAGIWVLLSSETNFAGRFQYPALVIISISWPALMRRIRIEWDSTFRENSTSRFTRGLLAIGVVGVCLWYPLSNLRGP